MAGFESCFSRYSATDIIRRLCLTVQDSCSLFTKSIVQKRRGWHTEWSCRPFLWHSSTSMCFLLSRKAGLKKLRDLQNIVNGKIARKAFQLVKTAQDAPTKFCLLGLMRMALQLNTWFNTAVNNFQVFSQQSNRFVSIRQRVTLFQIKTSLSWSGSVGIIARKWSPKFDEAIIFLCYLTLENFSDFVLNSLLHNLHEKWTELEKFRLQISHLSYISNASQSRY